MHVVSVYTGFPAYNQDVVPKTTGFPAAFAKMDLKVGCNKVLFFNDLVDFSGKEVRFLYMVTSSPRDFTTRCKISERLLRSPKSLLLSIKRFKSTACKGILTTGQKGDFLLVIVYPIPHL